MGKTIIIRQKQEPEISKKKKLKETRFCRNCGNKILKDRLIGGFCCNSCKEEYELKYKPQSKHRVPVDTTSLPYRAYS